MQTIRITILVENTAGGRGILAEHGLSMWIETPSCRVLFDTGQDQGRVLESNARTLSVPLERADAVVLSHGHYDHTGGLAWMLRTAPQAKVYAHPEVFDKKFSRNDDGTGRAAGLVVRTGEQALWQATEFVSTDQPTEICDGLFVTGEIPRETDFEDTGGPFFTDKDCQTPDPLIDDQAMYFESAAGTVVLLGCAHAGVVNTLQYIQKLTDGMKIHAVLGGMHLVGASRERIDRTIKAFAELGIERIGPAHCTGLAATTQLWTSLPGKCFTCHAGTKLEFEK